MTVYNEEFRVQRQAKDGSESNSLGGHCAVTEGTVNGNFKQLRVGRMVGRGAPPPYAHD